MKQSLSVLIAGEAIHICFLMELIFGNFNVSCSSVNSINSAKAVLGTFTPNLLVLDNSLLDRNGIDFIGYLNREFPSIGVILSIDDYYEIFAEGLEDKKYETIKKPFLMNNIKKMIEGLSYSNSELS